MRNRRGRKRKTGPRYPSGRLKPESPKTVAASQPHRRGLGDDAVSQLAATELGRLVLRGKLTQVQGLAGDALLRLWRGYLVTLNAPPSLSRGQGRVFPCDGCPEPSEREKCACEVRRRKWQEAVSLLKSTAGGVLGLVQTVVIFDRPCPLEELPDLQMGLSALADYFGLTGERKIGYRIASSANASPLQH